MPVGRPERDRTSDRWINNQMVWDRSEDVPDSKVAVQWQGNGSENGVFRVEQSGQRIDHLPGSELQGNCREYAGQGPASVSTSKPVAQPSRQRPSILSAGLIEPSVAPAASRESRALQRHVQPGCQSSSLSVLPTLSSPPLAKVSASSSAKRGSWPTQRASRIFSSSDITLGT